MQKGAHKMLLASIYAGARSFSHIEGGGEGTKGFHSLKGGGGREKIYPVLRWGRGAQKDLDPQFSHFVDPLPHD